MKGSYYIPVMLLLAASTVLAGKDKIVVAHRGASAYLPEHTLASKAMAFAMGVDYIEEDVVMTKDGRAVVLHDIHIDTVTDVGSKFPNRARKDGRYYAIDFTLEELQTLKVHERMDLDKRAAVYPQRFPLGSSHFKIHTLEEEIEMIQGLNESMKRSVGIYTEIKKPHWHRQEGSDISQRVIDILHGYGYRDKESKCYLQCFDAAELERIRNELKCKLKLVQLLAENSWEESLSDYDWLKTSEGLEKVASYADGLGPWIGQIVTGRDEKGDLKMSSLVRDAQAFGLEVHPYTFRKDDLPIWANDFDDLLRLFLFEIGVDGVFTDFPDHAVKLLRASGY